MSLINYPECGKQISDQAEYCIHCGYPIQKININNSYTVILKSISKDRTLTIRYIREINGIDIKSAMKVVDNIPSIICANVSLEKAEHIKQKLKQIEATVIIKEFSENDELNFKANENILHCPRCGSTAITTGQRGYSIWSGFWGSGKTVNRCANCGYSWEPRA